MSTTASEPSPAAAPPADGTAFSRDLLREQIAILRREAATRSRQEIEIHQEHEAAHHA